MNIHDLSEEDWIKQQARAGAAAIYKSEGNFELAQAIENGSADDNRMVRWLIFYYAPGFELSPEFISVFDAAAKLHDK